MATLPVFRLRNGAEHFYTISPAERDNAVSQYGYILEGIAFYAQDGQGATDDFWKTCFSAAFTTLNGNLPLAAKVREAADVADAAVIAFLNRGGP